MATEREQTDCVCGEINTRHCPVHGQDEVTLQTQSSNRPGVYYAAIKWPVADGPSKSGVRNDLEILALTLVEEHGWTFGEIEEMFQNAVDTVEWHL